MSAYAAIKEGNVFDEEIVIKYDQNSSDEEEEVELKPVEEAARTSILEIKANFTPDDDNLILSEASITVGLKVNESITAAGQFKLIIERGAILFNGVHYYHAPQEFIIIQPNLSSLPVISSTQVVNSDEVKNIHTEDNEHLFSSDYKSVIRLETFRTGLEDIGSYYLPFKNLFKVPEDREELKYRPYSFDLFPYNDDGIAFDKPVISEVKTLVSTIEEPTSFITIGNKNSGKSTISKFLINELVGGSAVAVLDLDPGQSEYSKPYCLSITNHFEPILGFNYTQDENDIHAYYGFSTPQSNPDLYIAIIRSLILYYNSNLKTRGHHLVINTPGWVKGYGKELLIEITRLINPDYMIFLSPNSAENDDVLTGLTYKNLRLWRGYFIQSKYSPSHIRNFNRLAYFHKELTLKYNFSKHILDSLPLKISFQTSDDDSFSGVNMVSVLNHDIGLNFNIKDLVSVLDASIVGIYVIESEYYYVNKKLISFEDTHIPYLNSSNYTDFVEYNSSNVAFYGVAMIHSVNTISNYFNMYLSLDADVNDLKTRLQNGSKLLLVKGDSEIPACEILHPQLLNQFKKQYKKNFKEKLTLPTYPYISFNNKINGVWKVRRNVMRRSQR